MMVSQADGYSDLIRKVRKELGQSQEQFAQAVGVSFATVNRWENGKTVPSQLARRALGELAGKCLAPRGLING